MIYNGVYQIPHTNPPMIYFYGYLRNLKHLHSGSYVRIQLKYHCSLLIRLPKFPKKRNNNTCNNGREQDTQHESSGLK